MSVPKVPFSVHSTGMTQRAAVYLRVSTRDQTLANQVPDLERMLSARGFVIVETYQDEESGVKRRPELERLLTDAKRNYFDTVLVWALDRLGRTMAETVAHVLELERIGVTVLSAREPWLDTTGPVRSLLVSVFAWVAQQERERLVERTNAGLARARAQGITLGRPPVQANTHAVQLALDDGLTLTQVARRIGIGRSTLYRQLARRAALGASVPKRGATQTGGNPPKRRPPRSSP
jgi:putative DNA-invertase from lambdoid prophage Rac